MVVKTYASAVIGVDATRITVEVSLETGTRYFMVGLPDNAVKEAWHRVESAIKHHGYKMPRIKLVINLAPADLRKEGSAYDLPMAVGILATSGQVDCTRLSDFTMMGELSLDGGLQPVRGALPIALQARKDGFKGLILPSENAREASVVDGLKVFSAENLGDVANLLNGCSDRGPAPSVDFNPKPGNRTSQKFDFREVKGQQHAKRAMEIAAAGGHNVLLIGPPGAGKTMMARRLPSILPPLSIQEALDTTKIHSVAGRLSKGMALVNHRPFRSPHHSISDVALVGGGSHPQPGEISLAHNGVLFLDELPEFKRSVLEVLRQPMEEGMVCIARASMSVEFPADFMLVASMNPCPCGYFNHPSRSCICPPGAVKRYLSKVSGPLIDRVDLHVEVSPVPINELSDTRSGEASLHIRKRVVAARQLQTTRLERFGLYTNAQITPAISRELCRLGRPASALLGTAMKKLNLSARAYDRILKVSRTIADLELQEKVETHHVAEAISFRSLDRQVWMA